MMRHHCSGYPVLDGKITAHAMGSWIEQMVDHVNPEHHLRTPFSLYTTSHGRIHGPGQAGEVINFGLGIKQVTVELHDTTISTYVESLSHKHAT